MPLLYRHCPKARFPNVILPPSGTNQGDSDQEIFPAEIFQEITFYHLNPSFLFLGIKIAGSIVLVGFCQLDIS